MLLAKRKHPIPSRTRKLSSSAPKVVPGKLGVRKGQCTLLFLKSPAKSGLFYFQKFNIMKKSDNIHIGHCTTPHGIKGEFSFVLYNTEESVLSDGAIVSLTPRSTSSSIPQDGKEFKISKISFGNKTIVTLDGVTDRNIVEAMVPFDIYFARENFPETDEDEYYLNDLLGLEVFDFISKKSIGRVMDFYENGVQVILKIKTENEILEILFIDQYVPEVDIDNGRIEIVIPEMIE